MYLSDHVFNIVNIKNDFVEVVKIPWPREEWRSKAMSKGSNVPSRVLTAMTPSHSR